MQGAAGDNIIPSDRRVQALHNADFDAGSDGRCQSDFIELAAGWELAPEPPKGNSSPLFNYGWGTHMGGP